MLFVTRAWRPLSLLAWFSMLASCLTSLAACSGAGAGSSEIEIRQLWDEYLRSKHGQFAGNAGTPSELWTATDQTNWPMYDLAGFYLPDGAVPEVLRVTPVESAADGEYQTQSSAGS